MPPRRNRIPLEHREHIVTAFEDEDEDYLMVADTLVVNRGQPEELLYGISERVEFTKDHEAGETMFVWTMR